MSYFNNVVANGYKVNGKYVYASAHYVIDLDGTIYQLIPTDERCYATNEANSYAIAIEVATTGKDNHYTDATYKAMVHLCAWLCQYKKLDCKKDIITHTDVVGKSYKECPKYMVRNPKKMDQFKLDCYNLKAVYRVIAGSYSKKETAETQAKELKNKGYDAFVAPYEL